MYRACMGCVLQGKPCDLREQVKAQVRGLGVTSIKWRCIGRKPRVEIGDPVWALTVEATKGTYDEDGEPRRDYFPGIAIADKGSKMIVFIEPGAEGRDNDDSKFETSSGFCKIPLSRITIREGERVRVCKHCQWPEYKGHAAGWSCEGLNQGLTYGIERREQELAQTF